ncbi:N-acetyltransferase [Oceanispirochaeta sp. M1]|nr:N-acetyltransferase [Oceanispirochaeta sp. M1]
MPGYDKIKHGVKMKQFPLLQSSRLILRKISEQDREQMFRIRQDQDINHYIDRPPLKSEKESQALITKIDAGIENDKWIYWGIGHKESSELIGTICLWNFSEDKTSAELGYELLPDFQKKGLMTEALEAVIDYAFLTLHLKDLKAYTHRDNERSSRLLERFDFTVQENSSEESENMIYRLHNEWE